MVIANDNQAIRRTAISRTAISRTAIPGILGLTLLLPASYFMLTLTARICFGAKNMYYHLSPSFLQSPFNLFEPHKAQLIICTVILAVILNSAGRRSGLKNAVVLQGLLQLAILIGYTIIQHIRY
jgi:hypothetical protein